MENEQVVIRSRDVPLTPLTTCIAAQHTVNVNIASLTIAMARAVTRLTTCSFIGKGKIICGESRGNEEVIPLAECVADVRNHLKSCHLSRTKDGI